MNLKTSEDKNKMNATIQCDDESEQEYARREAGLGKLNQIKVSGKRYELASFTSTRVIFRTSTSHESEVIVTETPYIPLALPAYPQPEWEQAMWICSATAACRMEKHRRRRPVR